MTRKQGLLLLLLLMAGVFGHSVRNGFIWDDHEMVENNPHVSNVRFIPEIFQKPLSRLTAHPDDGFLVYRPLQLATYAVERSLGAKSPAVFRADNLLIHLAIAAVLYGVFSFSGFAPVPAFLLTSLFAVHPAVSSIVCNITARHESLLAFFFLLSVFCLFSDRPRRLPLAAVSYGLALLSKETALLLAPALAAAFLAGPFRKHRKAWLSSVLIFIAAYEWIAHKAGVRFNAAAFLLSPSTAEWWRLLLQNIANILLPFSPAGYREIPAAIPLRFWLSLPLLASLAVYTALRHTNKRLFWTGLLTAFPPLFLLTSVGLITGVPQDHYLVLPVCGLLLMLASALPPKSWHRAWTVMALSVVAIFSFFSFMASYQWKNEKTFWTFALEINGSTPQIHRSLWPIYEEEGDGKGTYFHCRRAMELSSPEGRYRQIHLDSLQCLGALHYRSGEIERAAGYFKRLRALQQR